MVRDGYQAVSACLIEHADDGRVLLVEEGKDAAAGTWNLPAGRLEGDEDPRTGAVREALEEVGIDVSPDGLVGVYIGHSDLSDRRVINFVHHAVTDAEPAVPEEDTVMRARWCRPEELDGMDLRARYVGAAVADWQDGQRLDPERVRDLTRED